MVTLDVLLVEDSEDDREAMRRAVEDAPSVRLALASTVAAGVHLLRTAPPDVVVLDLDVPPHRGTDAVEAVRAAWTGPLVVYTGSASTPVVSSLLESGTINGALHKALVTPEVALRTIHRAWAESLRLSDNERRSLQVAVGGASEGARGRLTRELARILVAER